MTGPVATCEMALASAGIARFIMRAFKPEHIGGRLVKGSIGCVVETFFEEDNDDALAHFGKPMSEIGNSIVDMYEAKAIMSSNWTSLLYSRLLVPGPAVEFAWFADAQ